MFSVFGTASRRNNVQQENNVVGRKQNLTTRKPFSERKVDKNVQQTAVPRSKPAPPIIKKPEEEFIEFDTYSRRHVPDNYADILDPNINNFSSVYYGKGQETPPPRKRGDIFEPQLLQSINFAGNYDYDLFLNEIEPNTDWQNAPIPNFDFDFN